MDAYRRHCADHAAESRSEAFADWSECVDNVLRIHGVSPAAYTRPERFAAWSEDISYEDAAEAFVDYQYTDCNDPEDYFE